MIDFEELPFYQVFAIVFAMTLFVVFVCNYTAYFSGY